MLHYISRSYHILRNRGPRSLAAHSLKFIANKIDPHDIPNDFLGSQTIPGRLNTIGAVVARTLPDCINPVIHIPTSEFGTEIKFDNVAVVAHIFYPSITKEMLQYLKNIPIPFGLFITTDAEEKKNIIKQELIDLNLGAIETEIRVTPNKGRDVAPKYIGFRDVYEKYECFLHLHSKQSLHTDGYGNVWRQYLFDNLIGSRQIVESCLQILSNDNTGIVYPEHAEKIKELINWGYDFPLAKSLLKRVNITLDANTILEFPSGSMFWGRSDAIKAILDLNLKFDDFPEEKGQIDGTLAHAIERSLLLFVESAGFKWVRTTTKSSRKKLSNKESRFFPLLGSEHTTGGITSNRIPESYRILFSPDFTDRPRINLILPTVNPAHVFGGIDTALKIFNQIKKTCLDPIDVRIIVTDSRVDSIVDSLKNYPVYKIGHELEAEHSLVDATDREKKLLDLRPNDIFIATAWWTALNAFRAHDAQNILFGRAPKVVYIMQDFEPDFYGWSTRYALAESTYLRGNDTIAIINSEELANYFSSKYIHPNRMVIPYRINSKIDVSLTYSLREKIILFYSRPSAVRNCFESGIDGIALWARRNPVEASEWKVYCIGELFDEELASKIPNVVVTGKTSLDEYASLLSKASIGISLMISPHPSYPPLDMAYAGVQTITNKYPGKDLSVRSDRITSIEIPTSELIALELENQINYANSNMIGKTSPIRNDILDIDTDIENFDPARLLSILGLNSIDPDV